MRILAFAAVLAVAGSATGQLYQHRAYTSSEAHDLNYFELTILRNELYAMQGYVFSNPWLSAYFNEQDWYSPSPSFTTASNFQPEFTNQQLENLDLFIFAAEGLDRQIESCWYTETDDLQVDYYADISYWTEIPQPPEFYEMYTSVEFYAGAHPDFSGEDLLPSSTFDGIFTGYGTDSTDDEYDEVMTTLDRYGVEDMTVYRVQFRPDRTISRVEKVTLAYVGGDMILYPTVLWTMYYATNSMYMIFIPNCRMDWASRDVALLYTCRDEECSLRYAFKGRYPLLDMTIYQGPYDEVPLTVELTSETIGGPEIYESIFHAGY